MKRFPLALIVLGITALGSVGQQAAPVATTPATTEPLTDEQLNEQQLLDRLAAAQSQLPHYTGSMYVSENLSKRLADVLAQLDQVEVECDDKQKRAELTAIKIDQLTEKLKHDLADDRVLIALTKIADERDQAAEQTQKMAASGVAPAVDAAQTRIAASEARVKVEERKEAIASVAAGGIIPALNRDLVTLSIDAQALEHKREFLERKRSNLEYGHKLSLEILNLRNNLLRRYDRSINVEE